MVTTAPENLQRARAARKPPAPPLLRQPPVYKHRLTVAMRNGLGQIVAEFHPRKLVLRKFRGRKRAEFTFAHLWNVHTGQLLFLFGYLPS